MVDLAKRNTLIILGGSALVTAVPGLSALTTTYPATESAIQHTPDSIIELSGDNHELSISVLVGAQSTVKITNNTDKLVIVRHIYPGIVHAGNKTFDLNSLFDRSAYAVGAGKSRSIAITETYSTQAETSYPRHRYNRQPQRVASVLTQSVEGSELAASANSSRSFYA